MDYKVTDSELTGIANAIRTKGGTSSPLVFPNGFSSAISDIPSGGSAVLTTKNITQNGTYNASSDNADGYSQVVVAVSGGSIYLSSIAVTEQPTITEYNQGSQLDLGGIIVTATYSNGATKNVTPNCSFSPADGDTLSTVGTQTISISYTEDGVTTTTTTSITVVGSSVEIVPFATGTDSQIVAMIQAAHDGEIDLHDDGGWNVGDVRSITIGAFTGGGNTSHAQQTIDIVISQFGDYMNCGCVMQFDFKDELATAVRMNSSNTNSGGWGQSEMKTTTMPALVNALPSWLKGLLKEFSVLASAGSQSDTIETVTGNKLALRSEVEIFGFNSYSKAGEGSQIAYYQTEANRVKKRGHSGSANYWWERSPSGSGSSYFCTVRSNGSATNDNASSTYGVAPFGCI